MLFLIFLSCMTSWAGIQIDGNFDDWSEASITIEDGADMADSSGDIKMIQAAVDGDNLYLRMAVQGIAGPTMEQTPDGMNNRYYYHWLLDTDNDAATGFNNSSYEDTPTNLSTPIGVEVVVMIGWRDGKVNGLEAYLMMTEEMLAENFDFANGGDSFEAAVPLAKLGLSIGDTVGFSAFQEGASDGWATDWVESKPLEIVIKEPTAVDPKSKLSTTWASLKQ